MAFDLFILATLPSLCYLGCLNNACDLVSQKYVEEAQCRVGALQSHFLCSM